MDINSDSSTKLSTDTKKKYISASSAWSYLHTNNKMLISRATFYRLITSNWIDHIKLPSGSTFVNLQDLYAKLPNIVDINSDLMSTAEAWHYFVDKAGINMCSSTFNDLCMNQIIPSGSYKGIRRIHKGDIDLYIAKIKHVKVNKIN